MEIQNRDYVHEGASSILQKKNPIHKKSIKTR